MPTYEFRCNACEHTFERFLWRPKQWETCLTCGGNAEVQVSGGSAVMCKGAGFFSTDNRTESYTSEKHMHAEMDKMSYRLGKADDWAKR